MKNILVINSGSSSVKFQLIDDQGSVALKGSAEKLSLSDAHIKFEYNKKKTDEALPAESGHEEALARIFQFLNEHGLEGSLVAVGHRIVHGGEKFDQPVVITPEVLADIKKLTPLAPLHQPANILGIEAVSKLNANLPQVAVFDTAFHATMPASSFRYAVPKKWYEKHGVRKYGFHGTSYKHIITKAAKTLGKKPSEVNLVVAHLGSGVSMVAIKDGKSVNTTMGFSPNSGLPMGTRSGDIDMAIIPYMMERDDLTLDQVMEDLNKKSGQIGVSGVADDIRYVIAAADGGNSDAQLAFDLFVKKCAEFIAALMSNLDEMDALIFTGGMGENGPETREAIVRHLGIFGLEIDPKINDPIIGRDGKEGLVSSAKSKYPIYMMTTNEELEIAEQTVNTIKK